MMNQLSEYIGREPVEVGENLRLRQFTLGDANELAQLHLDASMTRWLLDDVALDNALITTSFIRGMQSYYADQPGRGIWAFERFAARYTHEQLMEQGADKLLSDEAFLELKKPSWQLQGWFNLTQVPEISDQVELGSRLHKASWGQRIACSVGEQLVSYAFDTLSLSSLYLHCHPKNEPALYCAAYLGFDYPHIVRFLDSDAVKVVSTAQRLLELQAMTDSQRRRHALERVKSWMSHGFRISA